MWRCDNVGGLGEHVKKHLLWLTVCFMYMHSQLVAGSMREAQRQYFDYSEGAILRFYVPQERHVASIGSNLASVRGWGVDPQN